MNAAASAKAQTLRCAIYTRKSSEEGLEQSFNSLHAQREACEAYVKSQEHEGWVALAGAYDDGGFSGGSMERPGLKALLEDVRRGRVDVVVVYKVDRLTRSLADFAKIVETFDGQGVSFVSVTQAFNTTTSMGRLTLNVLLSFAQFEREVTGERIRDKIAASKARGMWMGGNLPLGYDAGDHTLIVNEPEAAQVRAIFRRYLQLGSVHRLRDELEATGVRSKLRPDLDGPRRGGAVLTRGALFHLLQNRHYRGEICHKGASYPGRHAAIVDAKLFDSVQSMLAANRVQRGVHAKVENKARLVGHLFDASGSPMTSAFAYGRGGKRYGYYVSSTLQLGGLACEGGPQRLPVAALDDFIARQLRRLSGKAEATWDDLGPMLERVEARSDQAHLLLRMENLRAGANPQLALEALHQRADAEGYRVVVEDADLNRVRIVAPMRLSFRGGRTWLVGEDGRPGRRSTRQDLTLAAALRAAHLVLNREALNPASPSISPRAAAPTSAYERKLCRLALLSPTIQRAILEGRQPAGLTTHKLMNSVPPLCWTAQGAWLQALAEGA